MRVQWGVIPVAGRGTRMYPLSRAVPKELLPLGTMPVVQRVILELVDAGIRDIVLVNSPNKSAIRDFVSDQDFWRGQLDAVGAGETRLHLVEQARPLGLGHAVLQAHSLAGDQAFVVALGDSVLGAVRPSALLQRMIEFAKADAAGAVIALEHVAQEEVSKYGIANVSGDGAKFRVTDLVEKPAVESAPSRWAIAGRYVFGPQIHKFLREAKAGRDGEVQLTDAIREMIRQRFKVVGVPLRPDERRYDIGEFGTYFQACREFMSADVRGLPYQSARAVRSGNPSRPESTRIVGTAFARAGLLGNPSDGYGGKTISVILGNWRAEVRLTPSEKLCFHAGPGDRLEFESAAAFSTSVRRHGYYGGLRLVQAATKRFFEFCGERIAQSERNFALDYDSDIPRQVGLGGSSAIVIATLRALTTFYQIELSNDWLPSVALSAETVELGIPAGLQDRVIQSFEGLMYMDFSPERSTSEKGLTKGTYERLNLEWLPEMYVAVSESAAEPTEVVHSDLRQRFERGDADVVAAMRQFAHFAELGRQAILDRDTRRLGELMNANFDLRRSISRIQPAHIRMIDAARNAGASAKFCGSGGAIIGICPDGESYDRVVAALAAVGAIVFRAKIGLWHNESASNSLG